MSRRSISARRITSSRGVSQGRVSRVVNPAVSTLRKSVVVNNPIRQSRVKVPRVVGASPGRRIVGGIPPSTQIMRGSRVLPSRASRVMTNSTVMPTRASRVLGSKSINRNRIGVSRSRPSKFKFKSY